MSMTERGERHGFDDRVESVKALLAARGDDVTTREIAYTVGLPEKQIREMLVNLLLNEGDDE